MDDWSQNVKKSLALLYWFLQINFKGNIIEL